MKIVTLVIIIFCLFFIYVPNTIAATISITGGQSSITANDEYKVSVKLSIENDSKYYLRGVFYKPNTSSYCGYTWNGSSWFSGPYSSNNEWTNFLPVTTQNNLWTGELKVKFNSSVNVCSEDGTYNFKIERFTQSGSSQFDTQNEQSVQVTIASPTLSPTLTFSLNPTPSLVPTGSDSTSLTAADSMPTPTTFQSSSNTDSSGNNSDPTSTPTPTSQPIATQITPSTTPIITGDSQSANVSDAITSDPTSGSSAVSDTTAVITPFVSGSVLGLKVEPTSSGLSNDTPGLPVKGRISSGIWYLLFMGAVLVMAGCGIVLFQIRRKKS